MFAPTATRVAQLTSPKVNRQIEAQTRASLRHYRSHPEQITTRLVELDAEWDVERTLMLNSSVLTLTGLGLGIFLDRRWLALPLVIQSFLLLHAIQGWCPPVPIIRRLGVRTAREIEDERNALLALKHAEKSPIQSSAARLVPAEHVQPSDRVLEASEDSFPASDPPSWTRTSATPQS